jgi:hypothetical protein
VHARAATFLSPRAAGSLRISVIARHVTAVPVLLRQPQGAPPRPQPEAPLARRTAIVAFLFFFAASLALAVEGIDLRTLQRAFPLYALGGFSILIFGTGRLLIAGMAGRDIVGGTATSVFVTSTAAIGAAGLFLARDAARSLRVSFAAMWTLAVMTHVIVIFLTIRRPPVRDPIRDEFADPGGALGTPENKLRRRAVGMVFSRISIRVLETGSLVYAAVAGVFVPLAYADLVVRASAVHAVLSGFVIVTIMSVAAHILPRFTRARIPAGLLVLLVFPALVGPIIMVVALDRAPTLLATGAIIEGVAFAVFGTVVATTLVRAHRFRLPNAAYAAAPVAIAVGGTLALLFALRGSHADQLATHGLLNVFGFVGLFVMAASTDLYGPALESGAAPAKRHAALGLGTTMFALTLAAAGTWLAWVPLARVGMLLYAVAILWQGAGIVASHRRAGRVIARFR